MVETLAGIILTVWFAGVTLLALVIIALGVFYFIGELALLILVLFFGDDF